MERPKEKLANQHLPLDAAAAAVRKLAPEMSFDQARAFAQRAVAWAVCRRQQGLSWASASPSRAGASCGANAASTSE